MPKRKPKELDGDGLKDESRRSSRRISTIKQEPASDTTASTTRTKKSTKKPSRAADAVVSGTSEGTTESKPSKATSKTSAVPSKPSSDIQTPGRQYWLMKAEPESRLEKGHDVKFSIDDLAARTEPEAWDGVRAYPARNNLRSMKKGDLAFFYHSSCKVPAIVGVMEIVEEHTPDHSAHDPEAPYYDASSNPDSPKWSVVHVTFRQKLTTQITLKDLKAFQSEKGNPLENMQMLKLTRLSVSKVSNEEWDFLIDLMEKNGDKIVQ